MVSDTLGLVERRHDTGRRDKDAVQCSAHRLAMVVAMLLMAPIAFAKGFQMWNMNNDCLYFGVSCPHSVVISILMAGWTQ